MRCLCLEHRTLLRDGDLVTLVPDIEASGNHTLLEVAGFVAWNVRVAADDIMVGGSRPLQDTFQRDEQLRSRFVLTAVH